MKNVTLQFPSILKLIDFTTAVDAACFEANRNTFTLTCELSPADIEVAKILFQANVLSIIDPLAN